MYKISENPPQRYPEQKPLEDDINRWAIGHLKSRREKACVIELAKMGVGYYLPLIEKKARRKDNGAIRKSIVPLFPSYISIALNDKDLKSIYNIPHISNLIKVIDQKKFVLELRQIQRLLGEEMEIGVNHNFIKGTKVRVLHGPLAGIEGEFLKKQGKPHLLIFVEMFGGGALVQINESLLSPV